MFRNSEKRTIANKDNDENFGYFGYSPSWLQWLNNPWFFLIGVIGLTIGQVFGVVGMLSAVMPQIEKRFNFSGFDIGMIAAANDVAAVALGLVVSHYGNYGNKAKWIGFGGILTGLGFIIFTLPHYIMEKYHPPDPTVPQIFCSPAAASNSKHNETTLSKGCVDEGYIAEWYYLALFLIGQFVAGVGSISLYAFSPTCFQECVREKNLAIFLGLWQGSIFVAALIAFAVIKPLLELYVDIDQPKGLNMTPLDPRWIGNWWVGYLGAAGFVILCAVFILGFPSKIKPQRNRLESRDETLLTRECNSSLRDKLGELPSALKEMLTNWTFLFNSMAINSALLVSEGLSPFIAKVLILQYGVKPTNVGNALALSVAPPLVIGVLVSSLLVPKFKLKDAGKKCAFLCFISQILAILVPIGFAIPGCDEVNLAGIAVPYGERVNSKNFTEYPAIPGVQLGSTCNQDCGCNLGIALPICASDNITYLSPCFAGCTTALSPTKFGNCSCVASSDGYGGTADIGYCDRHCKNWLLFLFIVSTGSGVYFLQLSPAKIVIMKVVRPERLSFAFGLQYMMTKIFAHIPGPILFGNLADINCLVWQKVCDKTGYCWVTHIKDQANLIVTSIGTIYVLAVLFFFLSWILYKEADQQNSNEEIQVENLSPKNTEVDILISSANEAPP